MKNNTELNDTHELPPLQKEEVVPRACQGGGKSNAFFSPERSSEIHND
jgi:hypothetical protein